MNTLDLFGSTIPLFMNFRALLWIQFKFAYFIPPVLFINTAM